MKFRSAILATGLAGLTQAALAVSILSYDVSMTPASWGGWSHWYDGTITPLGDPDGRGMRFGTKGARAA